MRDMITVKPFMEGAPLFSLGVLQSQNTVKLLV